MVRRKTSGTELAFDALTIEGGLLTADWPTRVAQLKAPQQTPRDYDIPPGPEIRDEISRAWLIAKAAWRQFTRGRKSAAETTAHVNRFTLDFLKNVLKFDDLQIQPLVVREALNPTSEDDTARQPVVLNDVAWPITAIDAAGRIPLVCAPAGAGLDSPWTHLGDDYRKRSAFGLVQEFLNASDDALWGLCSDGERLRLVRDNASLTRPAWVEVDLARICNEDLYPDFAAVWLLLHRSRFPSAESAPDDCILEVWRNTGREEGTRARDRLREGFEDALQLLGQGFLAHPGNQLLRIALRDGKLSKNAFFGELLRLVYRLIFLLAIEERQLLHPKGTPTATAQRYAAGYSLQRLRERALRRTAHDRYSDLWTVVKIVFRGLDHGEPALGLPALAGLFAARQCPYLDAATLDNRALLSAVFRLCWLREPSGLARVNWRDMGADELGYVYEGLLELEPQITHEGRIFGFAGADQNQGNARKTSGSYYTPDSLVEILLDSALDPVIEDTLARNPHQPHKALLKLAIVDPACGSGHFLLAAARRLAEQVARLQADGTPAPEDYRHALRQVVARCIYGVDLNPLAVELCKVALWMEAVDPGLPLTFLDAHIRHGNALLGTNETLMGDVIPDDAWKPLEGDDRKIAASLKKRNKIERSGQEALPLESATPFRGVQEAVEALDAAPDTTVAAVADKERMWSELLVSEPWRHAKLVHDVWCAAFVWPMKAEETGASEAPTTAYWRALRDGTATPTAPLLKAVHAIADDYNFFHWELAFPKIFARGGFDVVLGNPPWERLKIQEKEFFAARDTSIAGARNAAARKKLIAALATDAPDLWHEWCRASRIAQGVSHFVRSSGRYPLCGKGDVNTYALFAEHNSVMVGEQGRSGFIVPTGIATDDTTKDYFRSLLNGRMLSAFYSFENEAKLFREVHNAFKFALITLDGSGSQETVDLVFFARYPTDLQDEHRHFTLKNEDFGLLNPNTQTCPTFRSGRDARINVAIYRRIGVLWREDHADGNPWGLRFMRMLDMANDSHLFRSRGDLSQADWRLESNRFHKDNQVMLPLFEAKMIHHYDHRFGSYEGQTAAQANKGKLPEFSDQDHSDPHRVVLPRYWVDQQQVEHKIGSRTDREWLLGWRDICRSTDRRTVIASILPRVAVNDKLLLILHSKPAPLVACFYANLLSFSLDFCTRQKVGGISLKYYIMRQLPLLRPSHFLSFSFWDPELRVMDWMLPRVLELTYTAWDLQPFAQECGDDGPPYIWDAERRFQLKCELDAAFFHLYGITREDTAYILDTFFVVEKVEKREFGEFRTKRVVLECYDALANAQANEQPYVSPLGPPRRAT